MGEGARGFDPFFVSSFLLMLTMLLLALLVTTSTLTIHAVESMIDRRRALAGLVGQIVVTIFLTWLAIRLAVLAVTLWLGRATAPANLRTE